MLLNRTRELNYLDRRYALSSAVTTGDLWRFSTLTPSVSLICKDVNSFLAPQNLNELAAVLAVVLPD